MAEGGRITQLDGVRGIAIAMVFIRHAAHVRLMWMGVDLFFVLSGFLITGILYKEKSQPIRSYMGGFYARRARRILPPYLVMLLLVTLFIQSGWLKYWYFSFGGMNFLEAFHPNLAPPMPLWSLAVEEQFYLLWPLAVYYLDRKNMIRCALGMLAIAPMLRYVCTPLFAREWPVYMLLPFRMDTMAAGALLALFWPDLKVRLAAVPKLRWQISSAAIAVATLGVVSLYLLEKHHLSPVSNKPMANLATYECTLGICASFFVVALTGFGKRLLTLWPLTFLGQISYTFYLAHIPVIIILSRYSQSQFLLPLIATTAFSTVMWYLVEKPILSYKRSQVDSPVQAGLVSVPVAD